MGLPRHLSFAPVSDYLHGTDDAPLAFAGSFES